MNGFVDQNIVLPLIVCLMERNQSSEALDLYKSVENPNYGTKAAVVKGLVMNNQIKQAIEMADRRMGHLFIEYYTTIGDVKSVQRVYEQFEKNDLAMAAMIRFSFLFVQPLPDIDNLPHYYTNTMKALVTYHLGKDNVDKAKEYHGKIVEFNDIIFSKFTKKDLIGYYAKKGDFENAEIELRDYLDKYPPTEQIFHLLIKAGSKHNNTELVKKYYSLLEDYNLHLTSASFACIISSYMELDMNLAIEMYKKFQQSKIKPSKEFYTTLMIYYARLGKTSQMENIYETLTSVKNNTKQSLYLLNSLLTGYCLTGNFDKVFKLYDSVYKSPKQKLSLNVDAFSYFGQDLLINAFGITAVTVCGILDCCGFEKDYKKLKFYWNRLQNDGFPLVKNNYCSYVEALLRCGKETEAYRVVERLPFHDSKIHTNFMALCKDKVLKERLGKSMDRGRRVGVVVLPPVDFVE
ncbi:hypothetical protein HDV01_005740 [Terramyces sp. JEL0728]|nr:hypothetical protein HDV01_005740 [Terramyces sp. JEL0728]